jgi:thioester reductase-like protein
VFAVESELSQPPRLVFASSISAVHSKSSSSLVWLVRPLTLTTDFDPPVPVPELPTEDPTIAISTGYSESKWVNETILLRAAQAVPGLDISIVRIGQIAGSRNGAWDIAQWPPSVMVSGPVLGCLPMLDGVCHSLPRSLHLSHILQVVSWTPMAEVVDVMKDLAISHDVPPQVVHLDHPHPTSWAEMIKHVADEIDVPVVSYDAWLEALDKSISNDLLTPILQQRRDHALRLRSVFHGFQHVLSRCTIKPNEAIFRMPTLGKTQMLKFSPKLNDVKPISKQDVLGWLKYWQSIDMM